MGKCIQTKLGQFFLMLKSCVWTLLLFLFFLFHANTHTHTFYKFFFSVPLFSLIYDVAFVAAKYLVTWLLAKDIRKQNIFLTFGQCSIRAGKNENNAGKQYEKKTDTHRAHREQRERERTNTEINKFSFVLSAFESKHDSLAYRFSRKKTDVKRYAIANIYAYIVDRTIYFCSQFMTIVYLLISFHILFQLN